MKPFRTLLAGLLLLLPAAVGLAQVTVPELTPEGRFVRLNYTGDVPTPDTGQNAYQLLLDDTCEAHPLGDGKFLIVAANGTHSGLMSVATQRWELISVVVVDPATGEQTTKKIPNILPDGFKIETYRFTFSVGKAGPVNPDDPDDPVDPDNPDNPDNPDDPDVPLPPEPADPWHVADAVAEAAKTVPLESRRQATETAKLFEAAADGLIPETDTVRFPDITDAATWLKEERTKLWGTKATSWSPVVQAINVIWLDPDTKPKNKAEVAAFYRAIGYGLRKAQAF